MFAEIWSVRMNQVHCWQCFLVWACFPRRDPADTATFQRSCVHGVVRVANSGGCGDCVRLNVVVSLDCCFCGGLLVVSCVLAVLFLRVVFVL